MHRNDTSRALRNKYLVRGITLLEVCVVMAILAILMALLGPVFGSARNRSLQADDISRLHQLGIAAQMYEDQSGIWPLGVPPLVSAGLVPQVLAVSRYDNTKTGWANELVNYFKPDSRLYDHLDTTYRRSFIGPYDYAKSQSWFKSEVLGSPGAGWLVNISETTGDKPSDKYVFPKGRYTRLLNSGGIVVKSHRYSETNEGRSWKVSSLFVDEK